MLSNVPTAIKWPKMKRNLLYIGFFLWINMEQLPDQLVFKIWPIFCYQSVVLPISRQLALIGPQTLPNDVMNWRHTSRSHPRRCWNNHSNRWIAFRNIDTRLLWARKASSARLQGRVQGGPEQLLGYGYIEWLLHSTRNRQVGPACLSLRMIDYYPHADTFDGTTYLDEQPVTILWL